ncbi:hypothetical protein [Actinoallomurus sp. NPDC052274]|uniref:hypothetical protein n=1 Tax=Actinoallomurus sp. NPDC052274 TaxID=3155420 RepID=UPI00343238FE
MKWIFAQRLARHSVARIARALNDTEIPCPSAADQSATPIARDGSGPRRRCGASWPIPATPAGRCGTASPPSMI